MSEIKGNARSKRKRRRRPVRSAAPAAQYPSLSGIKGGRYSPLNDSDLGIVDRAVREILQQVGNRAAGVCTSKTYRLKYTASHRIRSVAS